MPAPAGLDHLTVAFSYVGIARELVAQVKYRNARGAVGWLAQVMVDRLGADRSFDVVAWAPTTPERRRARGFDHAELLARAVGRRTRVPVRSLLRRGPGAAQTGTGRIARRAGPRIESRVGLSGHHVLLVDDVVTTGATLTAAAAALRRGGAGAVDGLTAARTP